MITIQQVDNGFLYGNDIGEQKGMLAFEEDDNTTDNFHDLDCVKRLLYQLIEDLGCLGSKHDKRRIRVEIVNQQEA